MPLLFTNYIYLKFKIEKIRIGHNGKGAGAGWLFKIKLYIIFKINSNLLYILLRFLDFIEIEVPSKGHKYKYSF
jgi:hypothetical protein